MVTLVDFWEYYLEGWPFVFFHLEKGLCVALSTHADAEVSCKCSRGQCKVGSCGAIAVGGHCRFAHHFVVGVTQGKFQRFALHHSLRGALFDVAEQYGGMYGLPWAVDAAVGKHVDHIERRLVVVIIEIVPCRGGRRSVVVGSVGAHE